MESKKSLPQPLQKNRYFLCKHCLTQFKSEIKFLNHECEEMRRISSLDDIIGQNAFKYYDTWLYISKSYHPTKESYLTSRYYERFMNFSRFVHATKLADPIYFIEWAIKRNRDINTWESNDVYIDYLVYIDNNYPAMRSIRTAVNYILDITDEAEVDTSEFFNMLLPTELVELIFRRKISPWFVLNSVKFTDYYNNRLNQEQKTLLRQIVNPAIWKKRFKENQAEIIQIKEIIKELGL